MKIRIAVLSLVLLAALSAAGTRSAGAAGRPATATGTSSADLVTTMSPTSENCCGQGTVKFIATVTNNGPSTAVNVVITDGFMPASFISVNFPGSCTHPPLGGVGTITCTTGSLASGGFVRLTVYLRSRCIDGRELVRNWATATSSTSDPNTSNNTASGYYTC